MTAFIDEYPGYAALLGLTASMYIVYMLLGVGPWLITYLKARPVAATVAATLVATLAPMAVVHAMHLPAASAADTGPCRFVSMPDFLNADIGDLRQLARWRKGDPNSTNDNYRKSLKHILNNVADQNPDAVLVAGDLVEGHWGADVQGTRIFGKTRTRQQRYNQIRRAGGFYYREWAERFANRGLRVFPAVGDHEVGDNPWRGTKQAYGLGNDFKRSAFRVFKDTWAKQFTVKPNGSHRYRMRPRGTAFEDTAYAKYLCPGVLLVTVDVFARYGGNVHANVTRKQVEWLDRVLSNTSAHTVLVQGHTPVIGGVNRECSSGLTLERGTRSPFWKTLLRHDDADTNILYLSGEVHAVDAKENGGVVQISHGALVNCGHINYLLGDIYADGTTELSLHQFNADLGGKKPTIWATTWKRPRAELMYGEPPTVAGEMTVTPEGVDTATGVLSLP